MNGILKVEWLDAGREPQCDPNPNYPDGIDLDASAGAIASCYTALPYPSPRCGHFHVSCVLCGMTALITTAGRPDDPRSVKLPCKIKIPTQGGES